MIKCTHDDKSTYAIQPVIEKDKENKNPNEKKNNKFSSFSTQRHFGKELKNNSLHPSTKQKNPKKLIFNSHSKNIVDVIYLEKCEEREKDNPQYVIEYSSDIYFHLKKTEVKYN